MSEAPAFITTGFSLILNNPIVLLFLFLFLFLLCLRRFPLESQPAKRQPNGGACPFLRVHPPYLQCAFIEGRGPERWDEVDEAVSQLALP